MKKIISWICLLSLTLTTPFQALAEAESTTQRYSASLTGARLMMREVRTESELKYDKLWPEFRRLRNRERAALWSLYGGLGGLALFGGTGAIYFAAANSYTASYMHAAGATFLVLGGLCLIGGVVLWQTLPPDTEEYEDFIHQGGGKVRASVRYRSQPRRSLSLVPVVTEGGGGLTAQLRF